MMPEGCAVWINFQGITDKSNLIPEELFFYFGCLIATKSFLSFYVGGMSPNPNNCPSQAGDVLISRHQQSFLF